MKTSRLLILIGASMLALSGCVPAGGESEQPAPSSSEPTSSEVSSSESQESSQQSESSSEEPEEYYVKEPTTITIWTTFNDTYQAIINNAIAELQEIEPNITVNNVKQQGSYDDLKKMCIDGAAVDNYPDLVAAYPDSVADFINYNIALDIDPYMNNSKYGWTEDDFNDIPESYIEAGQKYSIPGTYSLPNAKSTEAMYYNQTVLVGLDLSAYDSSINGGRPLNDAYLQSLTWEELFEHLVPALDAYDQAQDSAHKIIDRTTFTDWAWVGYDSDDNLFITLAEQYGYGYTSINQTTGKGILNFNNDDMKGLMKKFKGYNDKHYFTTKGVINTNVNYRSTANAMLFSIGSTGGVKYQFSSDNPLNVGVAMIPQAAGRAKRVISQGPDFAFLDHQVDNRALATWLFYKLFTSTKYNTAWATTTGYSPIRYSVMETEDYLDYSNYLDKDDNTLARLTAFNASYAASILDYLFTSPVFKGSSTARQQVGTIYAACVSAGDDLDNQINSIFQTAYDNTILKM